MIKRSVFASLDEAALRPILLNLFREMGYQDVDHYHGGVLEQGKDVTMWRSGLLGRENVVGLVKKGTIKGQANTRKGNAGEVFMQINQAFGDQYLDPSGTRRQANRVIVVSNGPVLKEARYSLESALKPSGLHESVEFWGEEKVWSLIEKHLGAHTAIPKIQELRELLSASNDFYSFDVSATESGTRVVPREKYPGASRDSPPSVTLTARFPKDERGNERFDALKRALSGRAAITLSEAEISEVRFSEPFDSLFFGAEGQIRTSELTICPVPAPLGSFRGRLAVVSAEGYEAVLEGLHFQRSRIGAEFHVESSPEPFAIGFVVDSERCLTSTLKFEPVGKNAKLFLDWLQFQEKLKPGSRLILTDVDTGRTLELPVKDEVFQEADPLINELVRRLVEIQSHTGVLFSIPEEVRAVDLAVAREVCEYFAPDGAVLPGVTLHTEAPAVPRLLDDLDRGIGNLAVRTNGAKRKLLGVDISLPPAVVVMPKPCLSGNEPETLLKIASENLPDGSVDISLVPSTDEPFKIYFEGWSIPPQTRTPE